MDDLRHACTAGGSRAAALSVLTIWPQEAKALAAADAQAQLLDCRLSKADGNRLSRHTSQLLGRSCPATTAPCTKTVLNVCQDTLPPCDSRGWHLRAGRPVALVQPGQAHGVLLRMAAEHPLPLCCYSTVLRLLSEMQKG
jgi:hypothetical protein